MKDGHSQLAGVALVLGIFLTVAINAEILCKEKVDLAIMVDSSFSITEEDDTPQQPDNWRLVKDFLIKLLSKLPVTQDQVRVSLILYGSHVETIFHLFQYMPNADRVSVVERMTQIGGNTNTSGALRVLNSATFAMWNGDRETVNNVGILITDGVSNVDAHLTVPEARRAKAKQTKLFTVGISDYVNEDELQEIASDPVWYHHFVTRSFRNLDLLVDQILLRVCSSKTPPTTSCDVRADVAIILDASGSIKEHRGDTIDVNRDNWKVLLSFTRLIIESLEISLNASRVALVRFSDVAYLEIYFSNYTRTQDIVRHVDGMKWIGSGTNTSGALRLARTQVFRQDMGDRPEVRDIAIVITDGESNIDETMTISEAMKTKGKGIRLYTVGITNHIVEKELKGIASKPVQDHYFNSTTFFYAQRLVNRIVAHLCHDVCDNETLIELDPDSRGCDANVSTAERCYGTSRFEWVKHASHVLVGHNKERLPYIRTVAECQRLCLKDPDCRSIDYVATIGECSLSHDTKKDAIESFVKDSEVDYYEWRCVQPDTNEPVPHATRRPINNGGNPFPTGTAATRLRPASDAHTLSPSHLLLSLSVVLMVASQLN